MANENEGVQNFVTVSLRSFGLFSRSRRLEEIAQHYEALYGIENYNPKYHVVLWPKIVVGEAAVTEDIFFAILPKLNFSQPETKDELFSLLERNERLCQAILARLGDIRAAEFVRKNEITMTEDPLPPGPPTLSDIIAEGTNSLLQQLAQASRNDSKKCKKFIYRLARNVEPAKLDPKWALTLATNVGLWRLVMNSKRWYERRNRFLVRLKTNEIFGRRLKFGDEAEISAEILCPSQTPVKSADFSRATTTQKVMGALVESGLPQSPTKAERKKRTPFASLDDRENIKKGMAEVMLVLEMPIERFREKCGSSVSSFLSPIRDMAQTLKTTERKLSSDDLSKLGEADVAEITRGGTYYSDLLLDKKDDSLNGELRAKGYSEEVIVALAPLYNGLSAKGFSLVESERILRLVLQTQHGVSVLCGGLVNFACDFIDREQMQLDKTECSEKRLRVCKNGSAATINIEFEVVNRSKSETLRPLFKCELNLSYSDDERRIMVEKSRVYITDQEIAAQARAKLGDEGFASYKRFGAERFELVPKAAPEQVFHHNVM